MPDGTASKANLVGLTVKKLIVDLEDQKKWINLPTSPRKYWTIFLLYITKACIEN